MDLLNYQNLLAFNSYLWWHLFTLNHEIAGQGHMKVPRSHIPRSSRHLTNITIRLCDQCLCYRSIAFSFEIYFYFYFFFKSGSSVKENLTNLVGSVRWGKITKERLKADENTFEEFWQSFESRLPNIRISNQFW